MAGEVESEMAILNKVVQAKDTLVTHGAAGCLNVRRCMQEFPVEILLPLHVLTLVCYHSRIIACKENDYNGTHKYKENVARRTVDA